MLNSQRFGWRQDGGRAMTKKAGLYGQSRNCQGFGLKGQEDRIPRGNWDVNEAGISLKINEMRKCHPHQGFWRRGGGRRFRLEGCRRSEPKRLNPRRSNQIQGFWHKRTQSSYLPWNLSVTAKIDPFFSKFKCGICPSDQGFSRWNPPILPPFAIKFLALPPDRICLIS